MHDISKKQFYSPGEMTFVSVQQMLKIVNAKGPEIIISELANYIEDDFKRWELFDKSPRYASHSKEGVIELMPTSDQRQFSFKYVNGHPKNTTEGLQTVTAFGVLSDVDSGYPLMLTEMTLLTALRTAATSALMAKYLAPENSECMAMIGCGAQSEFQILAFNTLLGIQQIRIFDTDLQASLKCYENLKDKDIEIVICHSASEAIAGAQIITTCTADKRNATILTSDMVWPGIHINAIGGDCPGKTELSADLVQWADVFVEYAPQTRIEGDIQQLANDYPVTEMHEVIKGKKPGRTDEKQLTIFDGVGFAVEDFSALRYLYDLVHSLNQAQSLDLLTNPDNPRNLFGMISNRTTENPKTNEVATLAQAEGF